MKKNSANGRILIWEVCLQIVQKHLFLGTGYNSFEKVYNESQSQLISQNILPQSITVNGDNINMAFNEYVELFVELGLIGLFIFYGLIANVFSGKNNQNTWQSNNRLALIVILISALFANPFHNIPTMVVFYSLLGIHSGYLKPLFKLKINGFKKNILLTILISLSFFILANGILKYDAYRIFYSARFFEQEEKNSLSESQYFAIYPQLKDDSYYLIHYANLLYLNHNYIGSIKMLNEAKEISSHVFIYILLGHNYSKLNQISKAEYYYKKAINIIPSKLLYKYFLFKLYLNAKMSSQALATGNLILNTTPKINNKASVEIKYEVKNILDSTFK